MFKILLLLINLPAPRENIVCVDNMQEIILMTLLDMLLLLLAFTAGDGLFVQKHSLMDMTLILAA